MSTMLVPGTRMYVAMLPQRGMGGTSAADADPSLYVLDANFVGGGGAGHATTITTGDHVWKEWSMLACNEANWGSTGYIMSPDGLTCRGPVMSRDWSLSALECVDTPQADHYELTLDIDIDPSTVGSGVADIHLMSEIRYLAPWIETLCGEVGQNSGGGGHRPAEYVNCFAGRIQVTVSAGHITEFSSGFGATYDGVAYPPRSPATQSASTPHPDAVGMTVAGAHVIKLRKTAAHVEFWWDAMLLHQIPMTPLLPADVAGGSVGFMVGDRLGFDSLADFGGIFGATQTGRTVIRIKLVRVSELP